jgi:predicted transcriptional regulator
VAANASEEHAASIFRVELCTVKNRLCYNVNAGCKIFSHYTLDLEDRGKMFRRNIIYKITQRHSSEDNNVNNKPCDRA